MSFGADREGGGALWDLEEEGVELGGAGEVWVEGDASLGEGEGAEGGLRFVVVGRGEVGSIARSQTMQYNSRSKL